ncbi:unnamed protein product [Caenorhabditis brenneri]
MQFFLVFLVVLAVFSVVVDAQAVNAAKRPYRYHESKNHIERRSTPVPSRSNDTKPKSLSFSEDLLEKLREGKIKPLFGGKDVTEKPRRRVIHKKV